MTGPDADFGRAVPVRPFVPVALARKKLWLASEHVANGGGPQVAEIMNCYKRRLPEAEPTDGDDVNYSVIVSPTSSTIVLTPRGWNRRNRCTFEGTP